MTRPQSSAPPPKKNLTIFIHFSNSMGSFLLSRHVLSDSILAFTSPIVIKSCPLGNIFLLILVWVFERLITYIFAGGYLNG